MHNRSLFNSKYSDSTLSSTMTQESTEYDQDENQLFYEAEEFVKMAALVTNDDVNQSFSYCVSAIELLLQINVMHIEPRIFYNCVWSAYYRLAELTASSHQGAFHAIENEMYAIARDAFAISGLNYSNTMIGLSQDYKYILHIEEASFDRIDETHASVLSNTISNTNSLIGSDKRLSILNGWHGFLKFIHAGKVPEGALREMLSDERRNDLSKKMREVGSVMADGRLKQRGAGFFGRKSCDDNKERSASTKTRAKTKKALFSFS